MGPAEITTLNGTPCISLSGRIDAANADLFSSAADKFLAETREDAVIIDCANLNYISSAGLRQILKIKKNKKGAKVINCSNDVYSVFDTTGFTQMMDISKAYRSMSVQGCEIVGQGAKGTVYRIDPETVLKVFHDPNALPSILREQALAKEAFVLGIPTAIPYDVVRVEDHYGSVFELLDCDSMASHLLDENGISVNGRLFSELLHLIHAISVSDKLRSISLPSAKQRALEHIQRLSDVLPAETFSKLHKMLAELPDSQTLIHGDLHAKNVMLQNGEAILIDMDTLSYGDPILELAYIFNAYIGRYLLHPEQLNEFMNIPIETGSAFWKAILTQYLSTDDPSALKAVEDRSALIGYSRLLSRLYRHNILDEKDNRQLSDIYVEKIRSLTESLTELSLESALKQ